MKQKLNNNGKEKNIVEITINILITYLKCLNYDYIKILSNSIMNNFILYKKKMIIKKITKIFNIYSKQELLSIKEKFSKWQQKYLNIS